MVEPKTECKLSQLKSGQEGHIIALDPKHPLRRRLLELGFVRGAPVQVIRRAPMGDPLELKINGTNLALRLADLDGILVRL